MNFFILLFAFLLTAERKEKGTLKPRELTLFDGMEVLS